MIWSTYQIINSIGWVLELRWGEPFATFSNLLKITQLNIFEMLKLGCEIKLTHYTQLFSSTIGPIAVAVLIGVLYLARVSLLKPPQSAELLQEQVLGLRATKFGGEGRADTHSTSSDELTVLWLARRRQKLLSQHINAFLLLTFIVLPTTSVTILRTFHCEEFDTKDHYLYADLSRECFTPDHQSMSAYAWIMVFVYPVG